MPSRQDQLHSYQFMIQRVVSALVMRETDPPRSPFRRLAGATLIGALLAALGFGGAAAYAVISPGTSTAWRDESAVIVEKETGALYVYRGERLQPVLNFTSALLILNAPSVKTVSVSRSSLVGVPRSLLVGIAGAPASLPPLSALSRDSWTVCSSPSVVAGGVRGGRVIGDSALLASGGDGAVYLLFRGQKHVIRDFSTVSIQFSWNTKPRPSLAPEFLNAVPSGADVRRPVLDPSTRFYQVENSYFVGVPGGFAALTPFQYRLLHAGAVTSLSLDDFTRLGGDQPLPFGWDSSLPSEVPEILDISGQSVCSRAASLIVGASVPGARVSVRPGSAAVVAAVSAPGAALGAIYLVTDVGERYRVPSADVLAALGYGSVTPVPVPADLLSLVPSGPALDPVAAGSCPNCR
jgi:type VII secretion protein EccB